jgi:hypothetical protein
MKNFVSIKPKNNTGHIGKDLKFMTIHQKDAKRTARRNN